MIKSNTETNNNTREKEEKSDINDATFAKNYLTFTQLSNGLSNVKNVSVVLFKNLSHQIGHSQYNYIFIFVALFILLTLIFLFFRSKIWESFFKKFIFFFPTDLQENSKFNQIISGKLNLNAKEKAKNENKILLKGRTVHRPANKYHYLLEKNFNEDPDQSVLSSETEDNMLKIN